MPKNKGKGGKNRRRGKNENESEKRELIFKEDEQEYAQVTKMLGNGRLEAMCFDGVKRLCHIRGKLRKKVIQIIDCSIAFNFLLGCSHSVICIFLTLSASSAKRSINENCKTVMSEDFYDVTTTFRGILFIVAHPNNILLLRCFPKVFFKDSLKISCCSDTR